MSSAVVLLSGGLDSSFNLYRAKRELEIRLVLTLNYGQRAAKREIATAAKLCSDLKLKHQVIDLPWFGLFTSTALLGQTELARGEKIEIDNLERSFETAKNVWVPNRNGILLNIAAGFAEGLKCEWVIPGFNLEEAQTFPDNTGAFLKTLDHAWEYSTANRVKARCYSLDYDKTRIVAEGAKLGLPFAQLWPCYEAGARWCGECESCKRYARALKANGLNFQELNQEA